MWGGFMEKAKTMAANIDNQINESVGVEGSESHLEVPPQEADNAWNDDFAFEDDDDDDDMPVASPHKDPEPTVAVVPPPVEESTPKTSAQFDAPLTELTEESPTKPQAVAPSDPNETVEDGWDAREEDPALMEDDGEEEKVEEIEQKQSEEATKESIPSETNQTVKDGWDAQEEDPILMEDDIKEKVEEAQQGKPEEEKKENTPLGPNETVEDGWDAQEGSPGLVDDDGDNGEEEEIQEEQPQEEFQEEEAQKEEDTPPAPGPTAEDSADNTPATSLEIQETNLQTPPTPLQSDDVPAADGAPSPIPPASIAPLTNVAQDSRYMKLQQELKLREEQLASRSEQLTQLQSLWEAQEQELRQKIQDTKEEAKKRVVRAKERCEAAEARFKQNASHGALTSAQQDQLIADLRSEGEALARKQSQMEQTVRAAHGEIRELKAKLADEAEAEEIAMAKIAKLEGELKVTKGSLISAQKGESQAGQFENDLLTARSDGEMKAATILSLQQQVKELMAEGKELKEEVEKTRKSAAHGAVQERKTMRREHNDVISDLETKLRTTDREAGVREDALRHEVTELRKRWQDAVRRADALSMDVQSSTSPLLRQLESMERQNRARAAAWAELENRLRSDLEEAVIQNETLSKERSEFKTKFTRLERSANDSEAELKECRRTIEDQTAKITKLETQLETLVAEAEERQGEYLKVERLANEGVMRVRSEMTQTVVDSEERYRGQIEKLEAELRVEKEKRNQLESQVEELLDNTGIIMRPQAAHVARSESKPKKLLKAEGQAEILAGALGLDDSDDETDDDIIGTAMDRGVNGDKNGGMGSFAALEQLTSGLKASQVELEALRKNLRESENTRGSLVAELAESRNAKEKLPLFEAKVKTLTEENREMELELRGLRDDITDVRELYRSQLNVLLEEKTSKLPQANGQPWLQGEPSD